MSSEHLFFSIFLVMIVGILMLDLGLFSKKDHIVKFKEAAIWSSVWIACAIAFYIFLGYNGDMIHGIDTRSELANIVSKYHQPVICTDDFEASLNLYRKNLALEFITGYLIEYSLSVDNIFVIIMILGAFQVHERYYKRVLFWGVLGAIVMRFLFIFLGAALIQEFHWVLFIFGGILIITGIRMFITRNEEEKFDTKNHPIVKFASKHFSVYPSFVYHHFFVKKNGKSMVTPLFLALLVIEFSDLIFAVDSVPAIFGVTEDPYIVFFSNIFAIMGLRSLFFMLTNIMGLFHYLKLGLSILLVIIGVKMLIHEYLTSIGFTNMHSLYIILGILGVSILASLLFPKKEEIEV